MNRERAMKVVLVLSEAYTVDAWANLTNRSGVSGYTGCATEGLSASANTHNQLSILTYDNAGNVVNDGNGNQPTYDAENRIAIDQGVTYSYDASGFRMEKSSGTMYWPGPGGEVLAETDLSGNVNEEYIYFSGERLARVDRPSGTVRYYFSDHLGSASTITDASGNVQQRYYYYPYGGLVSSIGSDPNHYKFTGKERDTESNLDNFGARFYTSNIGRFMTPDWAARPTAVPYAVYGDPQTLNLYAYVENGPVNRADADGHAMGYEYMPGGGGGWDLSTMSSTVDTAEDSVMGPELANLQLMAQLRQNDATTIAQAQNKDMADKRTDVMLAATSTPPVPTSNTGVQSVMDYAIVPQADTRTELQDKRSQLAYDKAAQERSSKMDVKLWESQSGGKWQWQGSRTGSGRDVLMRSADQRWYINDSTSTKRVQLVIGQDSSGNLIKAWTVHVELKPTGPVYSKVD